VLYDSPITFALLAFALWAPPISNASFTFDVGMLVRPIPCFRLWRNAACFGRQLISVPAMIGVRLSTVPYECFEHQHELFSEHGQPSRRIIEPLRFILLGIHDSFSE
jgi:hypothetical protein